MSQGASPSMRMPASASSSRMACGGSMWWAMFEEFIWLALWLYCILPFLLSIGSLIEPYLRIDFSQVYENPVTFSHP